MTIRELLEKRRKMLEEARSLNDKAGEEKRDLSESENARYTKIMDEASKIAAEVRELEIQSEFEKRDAERLAAEQEAKEEGTGEPETRDEARELEERSFRHLAEAKRDGRPRSSLPEEERNALERLEMRAFNGYLRTGGNLQALDPLEQRALSAGSDTGGGYITAPPRFVANLIKALDNDVFMMGLGTVQTLTSEESLGQPTLDTDVSDPDWTAEVGATQEDSSLALGKRELKPNKLSKLIKVSNKLLRVSAMDPAMLVEQRFAYKFGVTFENAFLNGNGSGQPLGIFTASSSGISTSRDVSTDNTTTAMTVDGLLNAFYSVKAGHRRNASWFFHRDGIKQISKMKDGTGNYYWQPSVREGEPDRFKGRPVYESEYAPSTFTTGLYVGIFGDMSFYHIAMVQQMVLQRLTELYAVNDQTGFIARQWADGAPVLEEAFARVKLA